MLTHFPINPSVQAVYQVRIAISQHIYSPSGGVNSRNYPSDPSRYFCSKFWKQAEENISVASLRSPCSLKVGLWGSSTLSTHRPLGNEFAQIEQVPGANGGDGNPDRHDLDEDEEDDEFNPDEEEDEEDESEIEQDEFSGDGDGNELDDDEDEDFDEDDYGKEFDEENDEDLEEAEEDEDLELDDEDEYDDDEDELDSKDT